MTVGSVSASDSAMFLGRATSALEVLALGAGHALPRTTEGNGWIGIWWTQGDSNP